MIKSKIVHNGSSRQVTIPAEQLRTLGMQEDEYCLVEFHVYRPVYEQILVDACRKNRQVEITLRGKEGKIVSGFVDQASQVNCIIFDKLNDRSEQIPYSIIQKIQLIGNDQLAGTIIDSVTAAGDIQTKEIK